MGLIDSRMLADFLTQGAASVAVRDGRRRLDFGGHASFDPTTPVGPYMHGPDGLFHVYDAEQRLVSLQRYGSSLATRLPAQSTNLLYPLFGYIMGWGPGGGEDEPATSCEPGPSQGSLYTCWQTAQFGRYKRSTTPIDVANVGVLTGRSEFTDFLLINPPSVGGVGGMANLTPTVPGDVAGLSSVNREFILRMMGLGVEFERLIGPQVYYGDPSNNIGSAGGYAEFPGLDMLIAHNHVDAVRTGVTCEGLDSLLYDYQFADVKADGGKGLVALFTQAMRYLRTLASMTNLDPVDWVIVMRPDLFNAIVDVWPCAYLTDRCDMSGNEQAMGIIQLDSINGLREAMRTGSFIEVDGTRIEVIQDSWIREYTSVTDQTMTLTPGQYSSDVYIIPRTVRGNIAATYFQYLDWEQGPMDAIREAGRGQYFETSDNGRFLWTLPPPNETCLYSSATLRTRLIELTPHLAAHFSNFMYEPVAFHMPSANPNDSFYTLSGSKDAPPFTLPISPWNP